MGLQSAAVRKLAVPDLTTTVLTLTITALAAESPPGGGSRAMVGRRVVSVLAMLAGAAVGAWSDHARLARGRAGAGAGGAAGNRGGHVAVERAAAPLDPSLIVARRPSESRLERSDARSSVFCFLGSLIG